MDSLEFASFVPLLHQSFHIRLGSGDLYDLELVEVVETGSAPGPNFRKPFTLIFANSDKTVYLPQRTYRIEHDGLGSMDLFVVPLGPDKTGMRYQVIFS